MNQPGVFTPFFYLNCTDALASNLPAGQIFELFHFCISNCYSWMILLRLQSVQSARMQAVVDSRNLGLCLKYCTVPVLIPLLMCLKFLDGCLEGTHTKRGSWMLFLKLARLPIITGCHCSFQWCLCIICNLHPPSSFPLSFFPFYINSTWSVHLALIASSCTILTKFVTNCRVFMLKCRVCLCERVCVRMCEYVYANVCVQMFGIVCVYDCASIYVRRYEWSNYE